MKKIFLSSKKIWSKVEVSAHSVAKAKVEILGRQYTLKGDVDPTYMIQLAEHINGKLAEMRRIAPGADFNKLVLLVCLNLADEIFQLRSRLKSLPEGIDEATLVAMYEKTRSMLQMLENGLIGEPFR